MRLTSAFTMLSLLGVVSSSGATGDPGYCLCDLDPKFAMPVGWDTTEVWVDVIILLDISEAMGDQSLPGAISLIQSLKGDQYSDVLVTDVSANFYTRMGLITMSDTADVIYSLNMTKYDDLSAKVHIKKGVTHINVEAAFQAALNMFESEIRPDRSKARQVIYYMTNVDSKFNTKLPNQFKNTQGIIIVNNCVDKSVFEFPGLKTLASDGYYGVNIGQMQTIQLFCKANCHCPSDKTAYRGASTDPAVIAAGGCLLPQKDTLSWSKGQFTCTQAGSGGLLVSFHDQNKAQFTQKLLADLHPKASYFWIGYSKSDNGVWRWEDNSTDPYTNWNAGEPSPVAVSKCAYADLIDNDVQWGAGNCQTGFPTVCEFPPCMVGNKC